MNNYTKKARYLGETITMALTKNKVYNVIECDDLFIRIIDDTDEDYLYDPDLFEMYDEDEQYYKK